MCISDFSIHFKRRVFGERQPDKQTKKKITMESRVREKPTKDPLGRRCGARETDEESIFAKPT